MRTIALMAAVIAVTAAGCSRSQVDGSQWIISSPHDTVTVSDAAGIWASLDAEGRAVFTESDNPSEAFLVALSGKIALERLVEESGMLDDPVLCAHTESWLRVESAMAARRLAAEEEIAAVNEHDIGFWRENEGIMVWFSADTPFPEVPFAIAELPADFAAVLHGLASGESVELDGYGVVTLDSLVLTPVQTEIQPDSVVALIIGEGRERFHYLREYAGLIGSGETGISQGFSHLSLLPEDSVVVFSPLGQWTRSQIEIELDFLQTRFPQVEASAQWSAMILENLVMQTHYRNVLVSDHPAVADSLLAASQDFLRGNAVELLVSQYLDSAVTVTVADLEHEYSLLTDPPLMAELRVFHLASADIAELPDLRRDMADRSSLEDYPGVEGLASPGGDPRISRPLMNSEVPGEVASVLFGIPREDTLTWLGPIEISHGYFAAFRLMEVMPGHPATIEEMEPQLNESARRRLESEAMDVFLDDIRQRFQVIVNDDVLEKLPPNPGQWDAGV